MDAQYLAEIIVQSPSDEIITTSSVEALKLCICRTNVELHGMNVKDHSSDDGNMIHCALFSSSSSDD